jgi:hypothetical protein
VFSILRWFSGREAMERLIVEQQGCEHDIDRIEVGIAHWMHRDAGSDGVAPRSRVPRE